MGPYGEQYFVPRNEISTVQEVTDVVSVKRQVNLLTLGDVYDQVVLSASEPLKKEFVERINKVSIEIASIKQQNEVRSIKLLALDYEALLKKLNTYLKESSQIR